LAICIRKRLAEWDIVGIALIATVAALFILSRYREHVIRKTNSVEPT
jgi:hypothetical protein